VLQAGAGVLDLELLAVQRAARAVAGAEQGVVRRGAAEDLGQDGHGVQAEEEQVQDDRQEQREAVRPGDLLEAVGAGEDAVGVQVGRVLSSMDFWSSGW
jgi:hypothetical protein